MTTLSGRVDALENQLTYFTQDLLSKIDLVTASQQTSTWNQNYDLVYNKITEMEVLLKNLQSLYANLNYTVSRNYTYFTGHTGQRLTGSNPAHSG